MKKFAVIGHMRPDGDAIGSILGIGEYIDGEVTLIVPDDIPENIMWLPYIDRIKVGDIESIKEADTIICCDFSDPKRAGCLEQAIRESKAKKISIDHHENPDITFWDKLISKPGYSSTCEIIAESLTLSRVDKNILTCLANGIITDTKDFSRSGYASNPMKVLEELIKYGAESREKIARLSLRTKSLDGFKLEVHILHNNLSIYPGFAIITLNKEEKKKFNYRHGMTDDIIEKVLQIRGINECYYFREEEDRIKISARSISKEFPVIDVVKELFGGGGHIDRAGADWIGGSIEEGIILLLGKLC